LGAEPDSWWRQAAGRAASQAIRLSKAVFGFIDTRLKPPRLRTTLFLLSYGALLLLAGAALGIDSFTPRFDVVTGTAGGGTSHFVLEREVGFLSAPNWSITSLLIWPAMFYVLRSLLDAAECVFKEIDASPMGWLAGGIRRDGIASTWKRNKVYLRRLTVLCLLLGLAFSISEWWSASRAPLIDGTRPAEGEFDWSAIRVGASVASHSMQSAFSFAAFLYQAVAISMMGSFAVAVVLIARTMAVHGSGEASPPLLVDIESNDPSKRGGFERFIIVIDYMIVFVALAFANFFLTRVQNAYLRDYRQPSLLDLIQQDFIVLDLKDIGRLFQVGSADYSSAAVAIGAVLALFQCFFFFNATLRHVALQARSRADHALVRHPLSSQAAATGLDREAVRQRLREMNVWPLGYSDLMPTLSFLTICGVTIVLYRIGLYLVFLWIAGWIVARAAQGLIRGR
jgi:hypothetical protein